MSIAAEVTVRQRVPDMNPKWCVYAPTVVQKSMKTKDVTKLMMKCGVKIALTVATLMQKVVMTNMPKEVWKIVSNHPNYEVSTMGRVRNITTGKLLKPYDDGKDYLRVKLDGRCERLHILVATAFVPNPENKPIVNHKKGKKHDCRASQLEWVTQSENVKHAWDFGLFKTKIRGGV